jgi:hypothetical protein
LNVGSRAAALRSTRSRSVVLRSTKSLADFGRANAASLILYQASFQSLDRKVASAMVGAMLGGFGAKADRDVLVAMLDMLEGDEVAIASGLWQPLQVSPAALALACRKLIATATYPPRPGELYAACREARNHLNWAHAAADELVDFVRRTDALLLEFDHAEWERPYLTPQYQPILQRMLELHDIYGDGTEAWMERRYEYDDDDNPLHPFAQLVRAEQAKLALPAPEEPKQIAEAACKTLPAKLTRKPKRTRKAKRE